MNYEMTTFGDGAGDELPVTVTECLILETKAGDSKLVPATEFFEEVKASQAETPLADKASPNEVLRFVSAVESHFVERGQFKGLNTTDVIEHPYSPEIVTYFATVDETAHRCIQVKASDVMMKGWSLHPRKAQSLTPQSGDEPGESSSLSAGAISEHKEIVDFLSSCGGLEGFIPIFHKACLDAETFGWAGVEVIRGIDFKIKSIRHVPAARIKVLKGWGGFVETAETQKKIYYQAFGEKVRSKTRLDPYTKLPMSYDPVLDGPMSASACEWRMVDFENGEVTSNFARSASEMLWIVKPHPATLHYGVTDSIPVSGQILANVRMREYLHQFFEHNAVPRYAVIIKGANLDNSVKEAIMAYFSSNVKGRAHKTMIIPLPTSRGNVEVTFEKLELSTNEQWFTEPSKEASQATRLSHGVAAAIAGFSESASLGSGKGMAQAEIYKDRTVTPLQEIWANAINKMLRYGLGITEIEFSLSPLDVRDREAEFRIYTGLLDRGVVSLNEVRAFMKLGPPIKGGDRQFIKTPGGILFVDELLSMKSGPVGGAAPQGAGGDRNLPGPPKNAPENGLAAVASGQAAGIVKK
jgi:hypothetical protein